MRSKVVIFTVCLYAALSAAAVQLDTGEAALLPGTGGLQVLSQDTGSFFDVASLPADLTTLLAMETAGGKSHQDAKDSLKSVRASTTEMSKIFRDIQQEMEKEINDAQAVEKKKAAAQDSARALVSSLNAKLKGAKGAARTELSKRLAAAKADLQEKENTFNAARAYVEKLQPRVESSIRLLERLADYVVGDRDSPFRVEPVEPVAMAKASALRMVQTGTALQKPTNQGHSWSAGITSVEAPVTRMSKIRGIQFASDTVNRYGMIGLTSRKVVRSYTHLDFAIYLHRSGTVAVYENGSHRGTFIGRYHAHDSFSVYVNEANSVEYTHNGFVFYTSLSAPSWPLYAGASFYDPGMSIARLYWVDVDTRMPMVRAGRRVSWEHVLRVMARDGMLVKKKAPSIGNSWSAGATSTGKIVFDDKVNGITFRVDATRNMMIGLTSALRTHTYQHISYAIYLMRNSHFAVYESGSHRGTFGKYSVGDRFAVRVNPQNQIEYLHNGVVFSTANGGSSYPLAVGASLHDVDAAVRRVQWAAFTYPDIPLKHESAVQWYAVHGVYAEAGSLRKSSSTKSGWWTGAVSRRSFEYNGVVNGVQFRLPQNNKALMIGLSADHRDHSYKDITFALYLRGDGRVAVYERGTHRGVMGSYKADDVFEVRVNNLNAVEYVQNGRILYMSRMSLRWPLDVDASLHTAGAAVEGIRFVRSLRPINGNVAPGKKIEWINVNGVSVVDGDAVKPPGVSQGWNGGAISMGGFDYSGDVHGAEFTVASQGKALMVGLSPHDKSQSYKDLMYAVYLQRDGKVSVYENGNHKGRYTRYAVGDTFGFRMNKLSQIEMIVRRKGKQDWLVFYTSQQLPHFPLRVDTSMHDVDARVTNVRWIANAARGSRGSDRQSQRQAAPAAGKDVAWRTSAGMRATSGQATKLKDAQKRWNDGALSHGTVTGWGGSVAGVSFRPAIGNGAVMVGLAYGGNVHAGYGAIDYAIYLTQSSGVYIYERGTSRGRWLKAYSTSDKFTVRLAADSVGVDYLVNDKVFYSSSAGKGHRVTFPLSVQVSAHDPSSGVVDVKWEGAVRASALAVVGKTVTFTAVRCLKAGLGHVVKLPLCGNSWNGGAVSAGSVREGSNVRGVACKVSGIGAAMIGLSHGDSGQSYKDIDFAIYLRGDKRVAVYESGKDRGVFGTFAAGDEFSVRVSHAGRIEYALAGRTFYTSAQAIRFPLLVDVSIHTQGGALSHVRWLGKAAGPAPGVEATKGAQAGWRSVHGVFASSGYLQKANVRGNSWSDGAVSAQEIRSHVWRDSKANAGLATGVEFRPAAGSGKYLMAGLSNRVDHSSYKDIDYALYAHANGYLYVYERGTSRGRFGRYKASDRLSVTLNQHGSVEYVHGDTVVYESRMPPSFPLYGSVSLYSPGAALQSVRFVRAAARPAPGGAVAGARVYWRHVRGVRATPGNVERISGADGGWSAGATSTASFRGSGAVRGVQFRAGSAKKALMIGLTSGKTSSYTDINFAFYLRGDGYVSVYESGSHRGVVGRYAAGDFFAVRVSSASAGGVEYVMGDSVVYSSSARVPYPLAASTHLHDEGASVRDVAWTSGAAGRGNSNAGAGNGAPVRWRGVDGVAAKPGVLHKLAVRGAGWNAGAASSASLLEDSVRAGGANGVTFQPTRREYLMVGLSHGNSHTSYKDIDFAAYPMRNGLVAVYEKGAHKGTFASYKPGDNITVYVNAESKAVYAINGVPFYTSFGRVIWPLLVDVSLHDRGATVSGVRWDRVVPPAGKLLPGELVAWRHVVGVLATPGKLVKSSHQKAGWKDGAASMLEFAKSDKVRGVQFRCGQSNRPLMIGIANGDLHQSYTDIDFALYCAGNGHLYVYERGSSRKNLGRYSSKDVLAVQVTKNRSHVEYLRNGSVQYTSKQGIRWPLGVDTSFHGVGAFVEDVKFA